MKIRKMVICPVCYASVPLVKGRLAIHNVGDLPNWMGRDRCARGGKTRFRRRPKQKKHA